MMDFAKDVIRWAGRRVVRASPTMKVVYILLFGVLLALVITVLPFFSNFKDYFSKASPLAQSVSMVVLFTVGFVALLFSWDRSTRADFLKAENERLKKDLKEAQQGAQQLESRWDRLLTVESRENVWRHPIQGPVPPFVVPGQRKTRFLAVLNLKGGVGKTTLAANAGACLALMDNPLRVLVVDIDFQGTLSEVCVDPGMIDQQTRNGNTVSRLLQHGLAREDFNRLLTPMNQVPKASVIITNDKLEEDDFRLQAGFFVDKRQEARFFFREGMHQAEFLHRFDVVIFDCPPRLTTATVNALTCSDYVLIPTKLDPGSVNAVPRTIHWLDSLAGVAQAQLVGVVANQVGYRSGKLTKDDQRSYDYLQSVVAKERAGNTDYVFEATIKSDGKAVGKQGTVASVADEAREFFPSSSN